MGISAPEKKKRSPHLPAPWPPPPAPSSSETPPPAPPPGTFNNEPPPLPGASNSPFPSPVLCTKKNSGTSIKKRIIRDPDSLLKTRLGPFSAQKTNGSRNRFRHKNWGRHSPKMGKSYFESYFIPGPISRPICFSFFLGRRRPETYFLAGRLDRKERLKLSGNPLRAVP